MGMIDKISTWPALRWPWLLLAASALAFELAAVYFQYGMGLEPCVMCVYQRVAVLGILVAALPALVMPQNPLARLLSFSGWGISAIWGLRIAVEHSQMQDPANFLMLLSCEAIPNFPDWLMLHELVPALFEPRGMCGEIDWSFLGYSMPNWMAIIFAAYTAAFAVTLLIRLARTKSI